MAVSTLAVGENMSRFAFDVNVAFLNAESTEEERIPVRMPEGCRKYCPKTGQELYGLLKKNLYGSPLAPKNWAKCRDQFMRELNQRDGWTVKHAARGGVDGRSYEYEVPRLRPNCA